MNLKTELLGVAGYGSTQQEQSETRGRQRSLEVHRAKYGCEGKGEGLRRKSTEKQDKDGKLIEHLAVGA